MKREKSGTCRAVQKRIACSIKVFLVYDFSTSRLPPLSSHLSSSPRRLDGSRVLFDVHSFPLTVDKL